jgi:hypothetical protein
MDKQGRITKKSELQFGVAYVFLKCGHHSSDRIRFYGWDADGLEIFRSYETGKRIYCHWRRRIVKIGEGL